MGAVLPLLALRAFVETARHGNLTRAAAAMGVTPGAVSQQLRALQARTGVVLFQRFSHGMRLTPEGEQVYPGLRQAFEQITASLAQLEAINARQTLTVSTEPSFAATWLVPRAVGRFNVRYPKARVSFQVEHWQALNRRLQAEEFEFFVADTRHFEADPQYRTSRLRPRRWHFCCREGHPLAARESVSAEELLSFPLATNISPPNIRKVLVDLSGRPDFRPAIECENGHSLLGVVLASDAIGISSGLGDLAPPGQGGLRPLRVRELPDDLDELHTRYGIVSRAGYSLSPLAEAMIDELKRVDDAT